MCSRHRLCGLCCVGVMVARRVLLLGLMTMLVMCRLCSACRVSGLYSGCMMGWRLWLMSRMCWWSASSMMVMTLLPGLGMCAMRSCGMVYRVSGLLVLRV